MGQLRLLLVTTFTYVAITVCGCLMSVFMGLTMRNFGGFCILFMEVMWVNEDHFIAEFGDIRMCNVVTYLPVCSCIAHGAIMVVYHGYISCKALISKSNSVADKMWILPWFVVNVLVAISAFVTASILTTGFKHTCKQLLADEGTSWCSEFQTNMIWTLPAGKIDPRTFHHDILIAQISAWLCAVLWLIIVLISAMRLYQQKRGRRSKRTLSSSSSSSQEKPIMSDVSPVTPEPI
ncbi:hypothetical protein CHUAL_009911 [Chamberlinius hualienensis]